MALVALLACLLASATAGAADPNDTTSRRAKALFEEGLALSDEGKWADALVAFEKSEALVPSLSVQYNIGASLRALGRYVEAEHTLEAILGGAQTKGPPSKPALKPALRRDVEALLVQVKEKVILVEVRLDPVDAQVEVDGAPLAQLEGHFAELDPGRHVFVVRAPGRDTTNITKTLSRDDHELVLTAPRSRVVERAAAPEAPFYKRFWFWTAAGAVVVAGAAVAVIAVEAQPSARAPAGPPSSTTNNVIPAGFKF